jgi:phage terminase large subunit-like protein
MTAAYRPGTTVTLSRFLTDPSLLGRDFAGPSWDAWRVTLKGAFGEPMSSAEIGRFRELAGRDPPERRVRELWLAIGRRGGKDSSAAAIAAYLAVYGDFQRFLRRGEKAVIACLAVDREQAGIVFGYIKATFEQTPLLAQLLVSAKDDTVKLSNGVDIVVATNTFRGIRGKTVACAILDEVSFWRSDEYANPDVEVLNALMPGMITLRDAGAMVIGISTVYRKGGLLYDKVTQHLGQPDDDVLAILAPSVA